MTKKERLAYEIASVAHKGQVDKSGKEYINHPLTVASYCNSEDERVVALLHDVVEDTNVTLEDLAKFFDSNIIDALKLLTHSDDEPYLEYVTRIKENKLAKAVKIADLTHNIDLSRFENPTKWDYDRVEFKYKPAMQILKK
jgi:(p)ppGpp synthase/HD superfamily hydrolase